MRTFEDEIAGMNWMRACGLILAFLIAGCGGGPRPLSAPATRPPVTVHMAVGENAVAPAADEAAPLSDAALIEMGEMLYTSNCAPCHQLNGEGRLSTFPALNRNPFVTVSDPTGVIDVVLHGRQIMPSFEVTLSDQEVAAVISYIRNAWNNQAPVVDAAQVREVQEASQSGSQADTQAQQ